LIVTLDIPASYDVQFMIVGWMSRVKIIVGRDAPPEDEGGRLGGGHNVRLYLCDLSALPRFDAIFVLTSNGCAILLAAEKHVSVEFIFSGAMSGVWSDRLPLDFESADLVLIGPLRVAWLRRSLGAGGFDHALSSITCRGSSPDYRFDLLVGPGCAGTGPDGGCAGRRSSQCGRLGLRATVPGSF
jgi:hypothetical protein